MAATRLSESQKSALVARFREGATSQELAEAFGCSPNTVSRAVKGALDPEEYERLKQRRGARRGARSGAGASETAEETAETAAGTAVEIQGQLTIPAPPAAGAPRGDGLEEEARAAEDDEDGPGVLAIDDADDFGEDDEEDLLGEEGEDEYASEDGGSFLPIPVALAFEDHATPTPRPLAAAALPESVYMLVDKTVELQARPLSEFPELGRLPLEEQQRQALVVFANPRQAKRQCGRSQRVIKIPDPGVLERTAPYLLAQGISRVVLEGTLYALPGSS